MANGWTPERKKRQADLIQGWKPWEKSTGPKSIEGKNIVSRNAWQGGVRQVMRGLSAELRQQRRSLSEFKSC